MGFLNLAFAIALALILLAVLGRQRERPPGAGGLGAAALAGVIWYAHLFPLAIVGALVALHAATRPTWRARITAALTLLVPLAPAAVLSLAAARQHLVKAEHATTMAAGTFSYQNPWEIVAHLWTDVSGALTWWGSMPLVPAVLLVWFAWKQCRAARPFLSSLAMVVLAAAYVGLPVMMSNWWYLNCRLVPFLWAGMLVRLPGALPRSAAVVLAASAVAFSAVTGIDYLRLDRDRAEFTAGIDAVPERATLLPLMFKRGK